MDFGKGLAKSKKVYITRLNPTEKSARIYNIIL